MLKRHISTNYNIAGEEYERNSPGDITIAAAKTEYNITHEIAYIGFTMERKKYSVDRAFKNMDVHLEHMYCGDGHVLKDILHKNVRYLLHFTAQIDLSIPSHNSLTCQRKISIILSIFLCALNSKAL